MVTRRTFLITGAVGGAALAAAYWMHERSADSAATQARARADAGAVLAAIAPVFLVDALPSEPAERRDALVSTVERVQATIARLPPHSQHELAQLFALLTWAPSRLAVAGLATPWEHADADAVEAMLLGWRESRLELKRSAYAALHQLVLGAWYAGSESWARIGYAGPPQL